MDSMDIKVLESYRARKLVKNSRHPTEDLTIWNYTDTVQKHGPWDEVTSRTRALVTDSNGNIVAHSFKKFHDIEAKLHKESPTFSIYTKEDGSLGVLFWHEGSSSWIICSRGSFTSEQAEAAKDMLRTMYDVSPLDKSLAYSFEIIYPGNRIVVDYKGLRRLVYLAAFRRDGTEVEVEEGLMKSCGFPIVTQHSFDVAAGYAALKDLDWKNVEGFVVKFHGTGDRVKIKFANYVALHHARTDLTGFRVWEMFGTGQSLEQCLGLIPEEFQDWVSGQWKALQTRYDDIVVVRLLKQRKEDVFRPRLE